MATLLKVRNGIAKKANPKRRKKARRRNPATVKATASKAVANPRRRRRRNPVALVANPRRRRRTTRRRRNGLFGDTKETVSTVMALGAGMITTKIGAGILTPLVSRFLTQVGVGQFSQILSEGAVAVLAVAPIARKVAGQNAGKFAMLGGLAITALDALDMILPDSVPLNPFSVNSQPLVLNQPTVITPKLSGYADVPVF